MKPSRRSGQHGPVLGSKRSIAAMQRALMERALAGDPRAVEMVYENKRCVPPHIAQRLLETIGREQLSQRELEVLTLVAMGLTNKEIAERLFSSDTTARNHVGSCLLKLDANDRTEASITAIRRGLIRLPD